VHPATGVRDRPAASYPQSSPQDTSPSDTLGRTADATRQGTPVSISAFTSLTSCFEQHEGGHTQDVDVREEADEELHRPDLPALIHPTAQNRVQLLQRFIDLHLGVSTHARAIFQYEVLSTGVPGRATTTAAMDTLCIAQVATSFGDEQLLVQSKLMYTQTMRLLALKIQSIGDAQPSPDQLDDIIGALHALTASSWFRCVGSGDLDWIRHAQALLRIVKVSQVAGDRRTLRELHC